MLPRRRAAAGFASAVNLRLSQPGARLRAQKGETVLLAVRVGRKLSEGCCRSGRATLPRPSFEPIVGSGIVHPRQRQNLMKPAFVLLVLGTACAPHVGPSLDPVYAYSQRDSIEQAYRAGFRDGRKGALGSNVAAAASALSLPAGLIAMRSSRGIWMMPAVTGSLSAGSTLWAFRERRRPLPLPPDSMRIKNGFESEIMWRRYQFGYQTSIDQRRERVLQMSARSLGAAIVIGVTVGVLAHR